MTPDEIVSARQLLNALHIPGTCIQLSNEKLVLAYNGVDILSFLAENAHQNLYFLANIPKAMIREVPHTRTVKDVDVPAKKYVVFDIDIRKVLKPGQNFEEQLITIQSKLDSSHGPWSAYRALVCSGNGLHIYYTEPKPVPVSIAQYSYGYHALCRELSALIGWEADVACSNIARIIRLPGSTNNKNGEQRPVSVFAYQDIDSDIVSQIMHYKHTKEDTHMRVSAFIDQMKQESILGLCSRFGIEVTRDNYIVVDGEKSSLRVNTKSNLIKRFSGKDGSGSFIDLYMMLYKMSFIEAARDIALKLTGKELEMHDQYIAEAKNEDVKKHREQLYGGGYSPLNWPTPLMDAMFPVIKKYAYVVLAGETKSGKSTVAFDMAVKNAKSGKHIIYITLEMSADQLIDNVARAVAEVSPKDERVFLETGQYPEGKHERFTAKRDELRAVKNLTVVGRTFGKTMTIDDIVTLMLDYPDAAGVVIDNLDKIDRRPGERDDWEKQKSVSNTLLAFTTAYSLPVILVHHLKKGQDVSRQDLFRSTNALSGSGKISHDADMVIFVSRPKDQDTGTFKNKQTFVRVMETREFEPCMHAIHFIDGTFRDDDPSELLYRGAYK